MYDKFVIIILNNNHEFLRFWKISRNRLAGDEPQLGDSSVLSWFWGFGRGTAWRHTPAARRCVGFLSISEFWMKGLVVLI